MASHFKQSYTDDFDREVKASPMASDSITKLHSGEGARAFSAKPKKRTSSTPTRGILIGVALAAIVVIAAGFLLFRTILGDKPQGVGDGAPGAAQEEMQQAEVSVAPATGAVDSGTIEYRGETYSLVALEGTSAVVATDESGNQRSLFVLKDLVLKFPENGCTPEELWKNHSEKYVDIRPVGIQKSKVPTARMIIPEWSCEGELEFDETQINKSEVWNALNAAGLRHGVGTYRQCYGRYKITERK